MLAIKDSPNYDTRTGADAIRTFARDMGGHQRSRPVQMQKLIHSRFSNKALPAVERFSRGWRAHGLAMEAYSSPRPMAAAQDSDRCGDTGHEVTQEVILSLIFESPGADILDSPDNICVTPGGGLILCEDGDDEQFLRGLTQQGEIFNFALNVLNDIRIRRRNFQPGRRNLICQHPVSWDYIRNLGSVGKRRFISRLKDC